MRMGLKLLGLIAVLSMISGCSWFNGRDTVKIGVIMPLTGPFAPYGKELVEGMKMQVKELEKDGYHINLIIIDNRSNAADTQKAYLTLVEKHNVPVVVGAYSSANTLPLKPLVMKHKVPVIAPTATNDAVTASNPYIFRTCFNDSFQARAIAWYARNRAGLETIGMLINLNVEGGDYSRGLAHSMGQVFERSGGKVIKEVGYHNGQKDFTPQLQELQKTGVQAVFAPLYPEDVVTLMNDAAKMKFQPLLFGGDGWGVCKCVKPNFIGSFYACMFADENSYPATIKFVAAAKAAGQTPAMCLAQGYDTIGILASFMTPEMTAEGVKEAIGKVKDYPGVTGPTTIQADGNTSKPLYIKIFYRDKNSGNIEDRVIYTVQPGEIK